MLLNKIFSSDLLWEILRILFEAAPYILGAGVLFTFIQQTISAYKKGGIKSGLIAFKAPIGVILLITLGFRLFAINPFFVVVPLMICSFTASSNG